MSSAEQPPADIPPPKLCHVIKWPDYDGYGFNLHTEKAKQGQFIGKVDPSSPADYCGLKQGDRIIEVNGINVANENHRQVVERIKAVPNETKLLVLEPPTEKWYRSKKIIVKSSFPNVKQLKTPFPRPLETDSMAKSSSTASDVNIPSGAPAPRLCHIIKRSDFDGYGFNLHADKNKKIQYIGVIDENSPAEHAGLLEGDSIVEVNGKNVEGANHKEIVEKIKAVPNETKLLVVDEGTAKWYREHEIPLSSSLPNIIYLKSKEPRAKNGTAKSSSPPTKPALPKQNGTNKTIEDPAKSQSAASEMARKPPTLRVSHLVKWSDFDGYGFNLHADKQKRGHFIGKVDPNGPADLGGLKEFDRIVEVNGVNVSDHSHKQIVDRIKAKPSEVVLLVVDDFTDNWYKSRSMIPDSTQANCRHIFTPPVNPASALNGQMEDDLSKNSTPLLSQGSPESTSRAQRSDSPPPPRSTADRQRPPQQSKKESPRYLREPATPPIDRRTTTTTSSNGGATPLNGNANSRSTPPTASSSTSTSPRNSPEPPIYATPMKTTSVGQKETSTKPPQGPQQNLDGLRLNMSVAEMKQFLTTRKKRDPREIQMDLRQKHKIIEQM